MDWVLMSFPKMVYFSWINKYRMLLIPFNASLTVVHYLGANIQNVNPLLGPKWIDLDEKTQPQKETLTVSQQTTIGLQAGITGL